MNAPDNLPTPPGVGCSALLDGLVIEVAARHRVMPATLAAWYELHRKNAQSPRRANLIPLTASQLEGLHNLRRAFRELLSHETCAEAHSTRQHKGLECSCDVMPSNAALSEAAGKETSK